MGDLGSELNMIIPTHPPPWQIMATDDSQRVENVTNIDPIKKTLNTWLVGLNHPQMVVVYGIGMHWVSYW